MLQSNHHSECVFSKINGKNYLCRNISNENSTKISHHGDDAVTFDQSNCSETDKTESWKKHRNKKLRALGRQYHGRKHDGVNWRQLVSKSERTFGGVCKKVTCSKSKSCHTISDETAKSIFDGFVQICIPEDYQELISKATKKGYGCRVLSYDFFRNYSSA